MKRIKQPLQERLDLQERQDSDNAGTTQPGPERDALRLADKMKRASDIAGWLNSRELKPPD
jgi:hypothetical protein